MTPDNRNVLVTSGLFIAIVLVFVGIAAFLAAAAGYKWGTPDFGGSLLWGALAGGLVGSFFVCVVWDS